MYGRRHAVVPMKLQNHRTVTEVAGVDAVPPASTHADWFDAQKYPVVRAYITATFVGGTNPSVDLGVWVRHLDGATPAVQHVARGVDNELYYSILTITGNDAQAIDVLADGDDILVLVENVKGTPTNWTIDIKLHQIS